jgi:hypothetical protein
MLAFLSMLAFKGFVFAQSGPVFSDTGREAEAYGACFQRISSSPF